MVYFINQFFFIVRIIGRKEEIVVSLKKCDYDVFDYCDDLTFETNISI